MSTVSTSRYKEGFSSDSVILDFFLRRSVFLWALCLASVIPVFIGSLQYANLIGYSYITGLISFLALIHVPITLYLFSDRGIRAQAGARPWALLGVPCVLIGVSIFMYVVYSKDMGSAHPEYLYYFMYAAVSWQHWHFGKQNVGVMSFSRAATETGSVREFERNLIRLGAICGVLVTYGMVGATFKAQHSAGVDTTTFDGMAASLVVVGKYIQFAVTGVTVGYLIVTWRSHTLATAILLLIGANFFLPQYLSMEMPSYGFIFGYYLAAHGLQYFTFLFFHSLGVANLDVGQKPVTKTQAFNRLQRFTRICAGPAIFALCVAAFGDLYAYGIFLKFEDILGGILNSAMGFRFGGLTLSKVVGGLIVGILLTHFWLDTFFWRLKDKAPREWARSRYGFVFQAPSESN